MSDADTYVLSGLISRGGFSNWVFFFRGEDLVAIDVGVTPTLVAGLEAGIRGRVQTFGPSRGPAHADDDAWLDSLAAKAKTVRRIPYASIASMRVHLQMMAHEVHLETNDGKETFGLMNRPAADRALIVLPARLGERFAITKSGPYAWFEAKAPFLVK